jgi:IS30 family transposase
MDYLTFEPNRQTHLTPDQRRQVRQWRKEGRSVGQIAAAFGIDPGTVRNIEERLGKRESRLVWDPGHQRLTLADREEIRIGLSHGESFAAIAARLERPTSAVSREVARNGGREDYRAYLGHERAFQAARRPKPTKLASCRPLRDQVEAWLRRFWSPQEITRRLRIEYPDDPMMRVSHETIYQSLYVQGRGELRRELTRCLRTGRAKRRPRSRADARGIIPGMVMISERPAEVADRAVPGHWEGDLILGKNGKSQVGTLVERSTRYVMLLHLPEGRDAESVKEAMKRAITTLPGHLTRSITWDQGKEMASHLSFTVDTGIQIYFCDPHSPWQRGSNENTNGLLRQYMPKGTDLSRLSAEDLHRIAYSLNDRPRATLEFMKPSEKLTELLR